MGYFTFSKSISSQNGPNDFLPLAMASLSLMPPRAGHDESCYPRTVFSPHIHIRMPSTLLGFLADARQAVTEAVNAK